MKLKAGLLMMGLSVLVLAGCTGMANHVFTRPGSVNLGVVQGFGDGVDHIRYLEFSNGGLVYRGSSMGEVEIYCGLPTRKEVLLDGSESWIYESEGVEILFEEKFVHGWDSLE
jgi:hypothetical protein